MSVVGSNLLELRTDDINQLVSSSHFRHLLRGTRIDGIYAVIRTRFESGLVTSRVPIPYALVPFTPPGEVFLRCEEVRLFDPGSTYLRMLREVVEQATRSTLGRTYDDREILNQHNSRAAA